MKTIEPPAAIPPALTPEYEMAIRNAYSGIRDPDTMRRACERMDRTREAIFQREGLLDFAVPTIRALRDGKDE